MAGTRKNSKAQKNVPDGAEFFASIKLLAEERGIDPHYMMDKITQALVTAYKRDHDVPGENIVVDADQESGTIKMFVIKRVVAEVEDPNTEISLAAARKLDSLSHIGSTVELPINPRNFGRIAAQNARQVIIQGVHEAERGKVYDQFSSKQHDIITGKVTRIDPRSGAANLRIGAGTDTTEGYLSASEQIKGEPIVEDKYMRVYVVEVRRSTKGPQIILSRTHPNLVKRLFEMEVPEIKNGLVEIKSIAREAGSRTKLAVWSNDPEVDVIGACVGKRGERVGNVVNELGGEKVDIIKYSEDPAEYIAAALSPADVISVTTLEEGKTCRVVVPDDQLSLAIGKEGQNARLAAKLTGYKIDIKPESAPIEEEPAEEAAEEVLDVINETAEAEAETQETVEE